MEQSNMKKIILSIFITGFLFLAGSLSGCSPTGYAPGYSSRPVNHVYRSSWDYDRYYRAGVARHHRQTVARERVKHSRPSGARVSRPRRR